MLERYAAIGHFGDIPFVQGGFILEFCPDWSDYVGVSDVGVRVSALMGLFFDKRPIAWSLPIGMCFTLVGIMNLAFATNLYWLLASVFIVGIGSSVLHPEASRITFLASGGKRGLAQSLFQVGGNLGGSLGPLLVALLVAPYGRRHIAFFTAFA